MRTYVTIGPPLRGTNTLTTRLSANLAGASLINTPRTRWAHTHDTLKKRRVGIAGSKALSAEKFQKSCRSVAKYHQSRSTAVDIK